MSKRSVTDPLQRQLNHFTRRHRDPRQLLTVVIWVIVLFFLTLEASSGRYPGPLEEALFWFINGWPQIFWPFFYGVTQFGAVYIVPIVAIITLLFKRYRLSIRVLAAGFGAWGIAKIMKELVDRGRPSEFFDNINYYSSEAFSGNGYPSGHAAVAAAVAIVVAPYIPRKHRKWVYILVILVGISRIYLGGHLPLDVIGGWGVGFIIGASLNLVFGTNPIPIKIEDLKKRLKQINIPVSSLKPAAVDARGSVPFFAEGGGKKYFVKLFGGEEFASDWMFKTLRLFKYKSFNDEQPFLSSKRNIEHEAFAAMMAQTAGVRTPIVSGIAPMGDYWLMAQEKVDGKSLDGIDAAEVKNATLQDVWGQVKILHDGDITHRDLRAANVFIALDGKAWLIDFGFAEVMSGDMRKSVDISELLASMTLVVGYKRAVNTAMKVIDKKRLKESLGYLSLPAFSGATRSAYKKDKQLLEDLKHYLADSIGIRRDDIEEKEIRRFSWGSVIQFVAIILIFVAIVPQLSGFEDGLIKIKDSNIWWSSLAAVVSIFTYVGAALTIVIISDLPVNFWESFKVQVASSFTNKLLPSGLGGAATNVQFLRKTVGHTTLKASSLTAIVRIFSFLAFFLPMALILILNGSSLNDLITFDINFSALLWIIVIVFILLTLATVVIIPKLRNMVVSYSKGLYKYSKQILNNPRIIIMTFGSEFLTTIAYTATLYLCMLAVGLDVSPLVAILTFATGTLLGSASPTPGGLGAVEAAMVATMIGLGLDAASSFAAVTIYRLITFWIPIPFGYVSYKNLSSNNKI